MMPHPALLSPHSLFGGREKGKRKGKKVQRRHPPRSHPIRGKAPPKMQVKKTVAPTPQNLQKRCKNPQVRFPTKKSLAARDPPLPPYPSNRPPRPTPIGTPSQAPLLGLGLAQSLVVRGLPHSGVSAGRSRAKKKSRRLASHAMVPRGRSGAPSRHPVRIRRPTAFFGVGRWRSSSGSAAWRARTRKRICCRFAALGSRAVGLFGEAGVGVAISQRAPEGVPGALGRVRGGRKKGKEFALART